MKEIVVRAGERTRVLHRFSSSIPQTFHFDTEPITPGAVVSGTVEVHGSRWLFRKDPEIRPLLPSMSVSKGFWDTLFSVYVVPDQDVRITFRRR
jgi:hypothetical protein